MLIRVINVIIDPTWSPDGWLGLFSLLLEIKKLSHRGEPLNAGSQGLAQDRDRKDVFKMNLWEIKGFLQDLTVCSSYLQSRLQEAPAQQKPRSWFSQTFSLSLCVFPPSINLFNFLHFLPLIILGLQVSFLTFITESNNSKKVLKNVIKTWNNQD